MTAKNKEKPSSWDRRVTVNFSIPLKVLAAIDDKCGGVGKRSNYVTGILLKTLELEDKEK